MYFFTKQKVLISLLAILLIISTVNIGLPGIMLAADNSLQYAENTINTTTSSGISLTNLGENTPSNNDDKTDRFIVKYKNETGRSDLNNSLQDELSKVKKFRSNKNQDFDIISTKTKKKKDDLLTELKSKKEDSNIEYIQPDYELKIASNDPEFDRQWGLSNNSQVEIGHQQDSSSGNTEGAAFDRNFINRLVRDPAKLEMVIHGLQNLPIDDSQYRSSLDNLTQSSVNQPLNEVLYNLLNGYIAKNPTYIDMFKNSLPSNVVDFVYGDQSQNQVGYSVDAGVVPAWQQSESARVVVAVLDTGIDITHEDLAGNIWVNSDEIPGNGVDDDGKGYIDDVNGWNFYDNNNVIHQEALASDEVHGTEVAGIIAAIKDNGKGIAGVAPAAKIMPLKVFENGKAYTSDIINAINYAEEMGAKVVNCSWGSNDDNPALKEALESSNMLFICAAGNNGANIDNTPVYPASFGLPNIITVASISSTGSLSSFSNYGQTVDVAAPGENIISTSSGNAYGTDSGTSMAAAFVSGEAALFISKFGSSNISDVKQRIIKSSDRLSTLTGKTYQGRKINCSNAVNEIYPDKVIEIIGDKVPQVNKTTDKNTAEDYSLYAAAAATGQFTSIACGSHHTLALKNDGTVWACGYDKYGQLGNASNNNSIYPIQVPGLTGITAIACGDYHSIALKNDGTVWAWGYNAEGELGDGTTTNKTSPVMVPGLTGITAIGCGGYHTIALKNDGTVWTWGYNGYGELGNGTTINKSTPIQVPGLSGITSITGGDYHTIALKTD
ncbi:MAG: S8 family serine peptidase, partial [Desulfosporosinus sp.]|nr:S8 family serine peptidase [Desulfosporosinus sp.]